MIILRGLRDELALRLSSAAPQAFLAEWLSLLAITAREFYPEARGTDEGTVEGLRCMSELTIRMSDHLSAVVGDRETYSTSSFLDVLEQTASYGRCEYNLRWSAEQALRRFGRD